ISKNDNLRSSTIDRLKQMQDKIISFMFIHKEAVVLAEAIKHIMNNLPKGAISSPRDVAVLKQWFYFMSDASMLKRIISGEQKVTDWLDSITRSFNIDSQVTAANSLNTAEDDVFSSANVFREDPVEDLENKAVNAPEPAVGPDEDVSIQASGSNRAFDCELELTGW
ncbi:DUF3150 domain-containing protein, partial [Salmonella enterica subsp. enterica serovar 4,[5],12:i:-]|nr:DUF3150 domain-containing protein [Salmonella enterica subsp. enterica serovar 4,[5],12:i:-]